MDDAIAGGGVGLGIVLIVGSIVFTAALGLWRAAADDPLKAAAGCCFFITAGDALLLLAALGLGLPRWVAGVLGIEGALFAALGVGILRESRACALAAAGLYTLGTMLTLTQGGLIGFLLHGALMLVLWKAYFEVLHLGELDAVAAQRRALLEAEGRTQGQRPAWFRPLPPAPEEPPPQDRPAERPSGRLLRPAEDGAPARPTGRLIGKRSGRADETP
jgi:hypothetical protein